MPHDAARAFHEQLARAMVDGDTATINELLDERASLTHMTGFTQPVPEWLREIETSSMTYYSMTTVREEAEGDWFAVYTLCDANIWGHRYTWHLGLRYLFNENFSKALDIRAFSR